MINKINIMEANKHLLTLDEVIYQLRCEIAARGGDDEITQMQPNVLKKTLAEAIIYLTELKDKK